MSFQINSDKEKIKGGKPSFIGENEFTIRSGAGADEREVLRTQLDDATNLPRVGINRTGERINNIEVTTAGTGYTTVPSVSVGAPQLAGGTQALASAFIFNGRVVSIAVNDPGSGYSSAPTVTITGGNGTGAEGTAVLDTVDFELDINGAIRTSTSIISDTARILNLDIDNFVTPDANFRGPNLKTYQNNTGTQWATNVIIQKDTYRYFGNNVYQALNNGQTGASAPEHIDGTELNGEVNLKHIGFRVEDPNSFKYNETGESGIFPRSITPLLGDRSDKIATTEYVLNLATNDVGGRVYVSSQIGSDLNDGRSAVNPVRTIKRAAQLAWATPGVKETLIVSGGDYVEDNPISLPPDASVVGDNLRLVIVRPNNPGKHIFKFGDKNYVTGVTYRDKIDSNGDAVSTWDFAMVFDDKQQVQVDIDANGDAGTVFDIGHQIFGPEQFRVKFQQNTGLQQLVSGLTVVGVNTGARAGIVDVAFTDTTGASAYIAGTIDVRLQSGSFVSGEQFRYITSASRGSDITGSLGVGGVITGSPTLNTIRVYQDPTTVIPPGTKIEMASVGGGGGNPSIGFYEVASIANDTPIVGNWEVLIVPILNSVDIPADGVSTPYKIFAASVTEFTFDSTDLKSIRAEGEVVSVDDDVTTTVPIVRIDFSQQGQAAIATGGFQNAQFGNAEDLGGVVFYTNELVGRQNIHNFKEGQEIIISGLSTTTPDLSFLMGKQRIYKVIEDADGRSRRFVIPKKAASLTNANYDPGQFAVATSSTKTVTLSLLNSPNKFPLSSPVDRRYQDACTFIRNNRDFIADEVVGIINTQFAKYYYSVFDLDSSAKTFKIYLGTSTFGHTYVSGGVVTFGGSTYNVTGFTYDNTVTGLGTITTDVAIPAVEDEIVKIENITVNCANGNKIYPSFSIPVDDDQCRQDIVHFLNALCRDLEFGSNHNIIEGAEKYIVGAKIGLVENEIIQTVRAIEYARELAIFAMCNWRTGKRIPSEPIYTPKHSSITRYFDDSVITSTAPDPTTGIACANVESAINTLSYLFVDVLSNDTSGTYLDAAYLIARNKDVIADQAYLDTQAAYPNLGHSNIDERKCRRDIGLVLKGLVRDLSLGGNSGILEKAESYFSGAALTGVSTSEIGAVRFAFNQTARYATAAMRNWTTGNYVGVTPSTGTYDPANGNLTVTIPTPTQGVPTTTDRIAFVQDALNWSCTYNGTPGEHAGPSRTDPTLGKSFPITNVSTNSGSTTISCNVGNAGAGSSSAHTFVSAITNGTIIVYDTVDISTDIPKFEDWTILIDPGAAPLQLLTPTTATYDPANGDFTITTATSHGLSTNEALRLAPESFVFTCAMDSNRSEHYLPGVGQPAYGNTLAITGTTTNTITVNVGASAADQQFTPTDASYDPATGLLDLTIGTHNLGIGEGVVLDNGAVSFKCAMDNYDSVKSYPRSSGDPYAGRSMPIVSSTDTTITINVGQSPANKYFQPTGAVYNPLNGDLRLSIGQHGLRAGGNIVLENNSLTFTCDMDNNATEHSYPRSTDPYAGKSILIDNVVFSNHTPSNVDYNPEVGELTFTLTGHGWATGDYVQLNDNALTFTCDLDGNATNHTYPRSYDYLSGRWSAITKIDNDTFKITGLPLTRGGNVPHTFVSVASGSLLRQTGDIDINVGVAGGQQQFNVSNATYDPSAGDLVLTLVGGHSLSVGDGVTIDNDSLSFTCTMDGNTSTKTYPRSGIDPSSDRSIPITAINADTITVNVGAAGANKLFTAATGTTYNPNTGDLVLSIGQHGIGVGRNIVLQDGAVTFTCDEDNNQTTHPYPRSTDPASGTSLAVTAVGATQHTATNAVYDSSTGVIVITIGGHGFENGDYIKIDDNALTFTCALDGNATQHTYPRPSFDPPSGRWLQISNKQLNTFEINVGSSSYTGSHTFVSAAANGISHQTGTLTVNVGTSSNTTTHTFTTGLTNGIQYLPQSSHTFVSATSSAVKHLPQSAHTFKRATAQAVQYLPQSVHTFDSATTNGVKHLPQAGHTFKRVDTNAVAVYASTGGAPACANVASSIDTEMDLLDSILLYATDTTNGTEPGSTTPNYGTLFDTTTIRTYPDSYITDQNFQRVAVKGDFDDFPIIEASPYTQNASVISFLGGGGALVDGSKVKQPNCPFPGLELDGTASFPNQGKSMVAAAFTIVSFGGTAYKVINDGYTQLVSVFVIFCADGVFCESGGYASITNSATNFGQFALRANGYRDECYTFDVATITNVSSTPTGRTILTVSGLGREPIEHYIAKIDGYRNTNPDIEFFVDAITGVTVGPPFSAQLTFDNGTGDPMDLTDTATGQAVATSVLQGKTIKLHRPSIVNSSSHTWEFAGSGTNYLALPENGGTKVEANEQVSELYGRVYVSGTDELGDFKVGTFAKIENRTGAITFTGTVTISEVEFLKLKGGDVVVTGFDASNTLGGANASDSKIPTQKAVKDFITNNLGPYINKPYSTNAVPRALVELTDSGKISLDQIPALRPFQVFTVADAAARTAIEGALAGDIAIQQDIQSSFILNNDLDSLFIGFTPDPTLQFTTNDIFTGSISGGRIQATEYRTGVVYQINIVDGGSGYTSPPTVAFSGGSPGLGAIAAAAECTIANGEVVTVTLINFNGFLGGKGYTSAPTITFAAPSGSGTQASGNVLIESRLYGDIVNNIAITDTDTFESSDIPAETVSINRIVNTSAKDTNNWVSLSSNQIAANDITSGVINTDRLANSGAANSFSFLRGDSSFALAVQSIKGSETRYFAQLYSSASSGSSQLVFTTNSDVLVGHEVKNTVTGIQTNTNITGVTTVGGLTTISLNNPLVSTIPTGTIIEFERGESPMVFESSFTQGNFVDAVIVSNGGSGFTNGQYFDVSLTGGSGTGLKANIIVAGNAVTDITVTDGGSAYSADFTITVASGAIGGGSGLVLEAKVSTVNRQYANVSLDVQRASDLTISADLYGTIGVARFKKDQFFIGQAGNGSIELQTGADSGLDADLLDGVQCAFYLNSGNQNAGTLPSDRLTGSYNIDIVGSSTNTLRLITGTNNPTSSPTPNNFVEGIVSNTINNQADGLFDGGTRHLVMTIRNGGVDFDATYGGARQLAFTDNDNMYLRGSGSAVTTWGTWQKVWTSLNDGADSGMDADRLDGNQGSWYQNALNIKSGTISERRLPRFIEGTGFRDSLEVKTYNGDLVLEVYVAGAILNTAPFTPSSTVKFYDANSQAAGDFVLSNIIINDDANDNTEDYSILVGRLTSGNLTTVGNAVQVGTASNRVNFDSFNLEDQNTSTIAELESDSGTAKLNLGRKDGIGSSPAIYFNSSTISANFNAAIVATGGNGTDGSGSLNVQVANADALTILGQKIWNEGNVQFNSANVVSTAVIRDGSGNFAAGTITASLTGAASLNVLKAGDSMTGTLNITGASSQLEVDGAATFNNTVTVTNDLAVDTDTLFVDVSADKVGINVGTSPLAQLHIKGDDGIFLQAITNGNGAKIRFADDTNAAQNGYLIYKHQDSASPNSNYSEGFTIEGDQPELYLRVVGDIIASRKLGVNINREPTYTLEVNGTGFFQTSLTIDSDNDNSGAPIYFRGSSTRRNFRIGNQIGHDRCFEISRSTTNGGTTWDGTPALLIRDDQRVAIATSSFSGNDPEDNTLRTYTLNINGDVNFNGQLFQNNGEFVTSRWTEATNNLDIYRLSKVGIAQQNPTFTLQVGTYGSETGSFKVAGNSELDGTLYVGTSSTNRVYISGASVDIQGNSKSSGQVTNTLKVNGDKQYIDRYGVIRRNRANITEDVTVASSDRCSSTGPIEINNGVTVTISNGGYWTVI